MPSRKKAVRQAEIVKAFAERLRAIRLAKGMTQRDLATKAQVTFSYVSRLEAGGAAPGIDLLERLAQAFEVDVAELLPVAKIAGSTGAYRERVKVLFDAVLPKAGMETLSMMDVFLTRLSEAPSIGR